MKLSEHLRQVFTIAPDSLAMEFNSRSFSWAEVARASEHVAATLPALGVEAADVIGWVGQNSPSAVASLIGLALSEHCAAILNPHSGAQALSDEVERQRFPAIIGDPGFWAIPGVAEAAKKAGSAGLVVTWEEVGMSLTSHPGLERVGPGPHRSPMPEIVIERISSGTTGLPKRTPQSLSSIMTEFALGQRKEGAKPEAQTAVKRSPSLIPRSLAHAGTFAVLLAFYSARPIVLQEKFTVDGVVGAIRRHRIKAVSLVPTMIKMIMDAGVPREDLSSLIVMRSGTAPLDPALQAAFEEKYGIPILVDYGATEFGGVASWSLEDHKRYALQKRGSVGRALKGMQMRVVDPGTREEIRNGQMGLLELRVDHKGDD